MSNILPWILKYSRLLGSVDPSEEFQLNDDLSRQGFRYVLLAGTLKERKIVGISSSVEQGHVGFNSDNLPASVENNAYDVCENHTSFSGELRGIFQAL